MDTMQQEAMRRAQEMHSRVAPAVPVSNARDNSRKESLPYVPETNHHRKASEDISSHSPDSKPSTMEKLVDKLLTGPEAFKGKDPIDSFCGLFDTRI